MAPGILTDTSSQKTHSKSGLTDEQVASYRENGYLIIPSFLGGSEVTSLLSETQHMLDTFPLDTHPLTKFSTGDSSDHVGDEYFLTSGSEIRFFFEENAFDPKTGSLTKPKARAVNKIGHNLHGLSLPFRKVTLNERTRGIARSIGFRDPRVLQSMVICKQPEIGGAVPAHQDSTFLYTDPPSAVGFWIALEDATVANGCLSFAPGSHRRAPIRSRFVRKECGNSSAGTDFKAVTSNKWPRDEQGQDEGVEGEEKEEYQLGEVKAGDLVLIHGNILHKSERNTSTKGRIIYTFHMIEGLNKYDEQNWLQVPGGPAAFTKLYEENA